MNEEYKELLKLVAIQQGLPIDLAEDMASLMEQYPDLSQWGSKSNLIQDLRKIIESALKNKLVDVE
jgi:hypothetical protein